MKTQSFIALKKIIIPCILGFCLALSGRAQGVFQASLSTLSDDGSPAGLLLGDFWFQVVGNEVDFVAFLSPTTFTSSLNPVLTVPGNSAGFSLGEIQSRVIGSQTDPNWNPFLTPKPLVPTGYDCDGNPYFIWAPVVWYGNFYSGHFDLPLGFLDELLAGNGKVELNSYVGGNISVTPTPEPTTIMLELLGIGCLLFVLWRKRAVG
jgi:hypothetical protein